MPKNRPATSGYARLAQAEEDDDDGYDFDREDPFAGSNPISSSSRQYAPIQPSRRTERMNGSKSQSPNAPRHWRRHRSNSGVDIKAINARLEKWADEIASKFKRRDKKSARDDEQPEIQHSVFIAPEGITPAREANPNNYRPKMSKEEFDEIVESVRLAIEQGIHPKLISQGSSGSYFARNSEGKTVAVFKPKDEEPYASRNPKWTKWIHRNLFPFFFGRACLIPNLSYISEAAAYVLDTRLQTGIVPYTDVVSFSSKSFHYDFWDRRAFYRKKKPLPEKPGSFQIFLNGYKDATLFLKEHPWPDQNSSTFREGNNSRRKKRRRWTEDCRPSGPRDSDDEDEENDSGTASENESNRRTEFWTRKLRESFQEQLEKLVILDYIMRNTDRGLDNWMIRVDRRKEEAKIIAEPPQNNSRGPARNSSPDHGMNGGVKGPEEEPYQRREMMSATSRSGTPMTDHASDDMTISIGAIDNSLSWPWKHPDAWRSYPFGWLFLPASLIGQPFSERTRQHFLPLLTSKVWWAETQRELRRCFMRDEDFQERMYAKQIAVMKGQAWNVVETLKTEGHGPLELTRRARVYVWDDLVDVPTVVPMRRPSAERGRMVNTRNNQQEDEEMDISVAGASAPEPDLLGLSTPKAEVQSPFNVSRQNSSMDVGRPRNSTSENLETENGPLSPSNLESFTAHQSPDRKTATNYSRNHTSSSYRRSKGRPNHRSRMSFEVPRIGSGTTPTTRQRRLSVGFWDAEDEDDGDLGFAATEEREANRVQVVVERLETVKGKNPFFTWC
ncbi:uncharacterized protein PV09_08332 [Verruconis gallopava]|uniref:Phosphatidylinositol 4-kinase n=1 Tax=Verruconis gallopava TaxID=253628 RepID=A0A0D1XD50_9PEZI|nr:uncharacterized protein PV09_08332 [Verruconis gallopava]KIW00156.1 hypothetical protein PV09_08332 [Verruconis gallopava]